MALLTAIVGATASANLTLIVLDVARERSARTQLVTTTSRPAAEPGLEPAAPTGAGSP